MKVAAVALRIPNAFQERKKRKKRSMAGVTMITGYFHFFCLLAPYMLVTFQEKMRRLPDDFRVMIFFFFLPTHSLKTDSPTGAYMFMRRKLERVKSE